MSDSVPNVDALLALLESLHDRPDLLASLADSERIRLRQAASRLVHPTPTEKKKLRKAFRRKDRTVAQAHDLAQLSATGMRASRTFVSPQKQLSPVTEVFLPATTLEPLSRTRNCYICKTPFRDLHFFYDSLCPTCATLNFEKRTQTHPLHGKVALLTGGRVKIGYQTALILLRAGADVVVTTRFPIDAADRFSREPDYAEFSQRLRIFGLDLRHAPSVELFAQLMSDRLGRLDILINNAAQTVRRPAGFYRHLLESEKNGIAGLPAHARALLADHEALTEKLGATSGAAMALSTRATDKAALGLVASAALSQVALTDEDLADATHFPEGLLDGDRQQVDKRDQNSWRMRLSEVPLPELLEVHLVNSIAPFLLTARLQPLMMRDRTDEKHVINVSAMEASFSRKKKTDKHPHTNMAKAALNMMTRTSASEYIQHGIFMNSVDTGWVTDEDPLIHVSRKQRVHEFYPPLDSIDGAARVLDPLFVGLKTHAHPAGKFFKDYRETAW